MKLSVKCIWFRGEIKVWLLFNLQILLLSQTKSLPLLVKWIFTYRYPELDWGVSTKHNIFLYAFSAFLKNDLEGFLPWWHQNDRIFYLVPFCWFPCVNTKHFSSADFGKALNFCNITDYRTESGEPMRGNSWLPPLG